MQKLYTLFLFFLFPFYGIIAQEDFPDISLEISNVATQQGETVCLDIIAESFENILGVSFTIEFDPSQLEFVRIENINLPGATLDGAFNTQIANEGKIGLVWTDISPDELESPFTLFSICLRAKGEEGSISKVSFTNNPVPIDVIGNKGVYVEELFQGKFRDGAVWVRQDGSLPEIPEIIGETSIFSCGNVWKNEIDINVTEGVPPYQFTWSGPDEYESSEEDPTFLDFGLYRLTVTDQNQTPAFATFNLTRPQSLGTPKPLYTEVMVSDVTNCMEPNGRIDLTMFGDPDQYTFEWSTGANSQNIWALSTGSYGVTITDQNGCTDEWTGEVVEAPDIQVDLSRVPVRCTESKGSITITNPDIEKYEYTWSTEETSTSITDLSPGRYFLTVVEKSSACLQVIESVITASGSIPLQIETVDPACNEDLGSIAVAPGDGIDLGYTWITGDTSSSISNLEAGNYPLTITDKVGGCQLFPTISLKETDMLVELQGNCIDNATTPDSMTVMTDITGGARPYTVNWSNGVRQLNVTNGSVREAAPGLIYAAVTDNEGCTVLSETPFVCTGDSGTLDIEASLFFECTATQPNSEFTAFIWKGGTPPYTFDWSNGFSETADRSSSTFLNGQDGFNSVTITDSEGLLNIIYASPLLEGNCAATQELVNIVMDDKQVEADETFSLPVILDASVSLALLRFEIHWEDDLLDLQSIQSEFNFSQEAYQNGKVALQFEFPEPPPLFIKNVIAELVFKAKKDTSTTTPLVFGYTEWRATGYIKDHPIHPDNATITLVPDGTDVWPGDTDRSRTVDHNDLLNIGLAYNDMGPKRPNASTDWNAQNAPAWERQTPESNINYRHIDTNGDGSVNDQDTMAIALNWEQVIQYSIDPDPKADGSPLFVDAGTISSDERKLFPIILGTSEERAENIYGLAFSIPYEGALFSEAMSVDFSNSWLGSDGSKILGMFRNFPLERRIDIALVRTDGQNISGFGPIAHLALQGNNRTEMTRPASFEVENVQLINYQEHSLPVSPEKSETLVDFSTGIDEPEWARNIRLYPIPAREEIRIETFGLEVDGLQLFNMNGQLLASYPYQKRISVGYLTPGIYLLRILTPQGVAVKKWVKQ